MHSITAQVDEGDRSALSDVSHCQGINGLLHDLRWTVEVAGNCERRGMRHNRPTTAMRFKERARMAKGCGYGVEKTVWS